MKPRKEQKKHNLSENSRSSSQDFIHANKIASALYKQVKDNFPSMVDNDAYKRLLRSVSYAVNADIRNKPGRKSIAYGNLSMMESFSFNNRKRFENFTNWVTPVELDADKKKLSIAVPPNRKGEFPSPPERMSFTILRFYAFTIDLDNLAVKVVKTKDLKVEKEKDREERRAILHLDYPDNCIISLIGFAQFHRFTTDLSKNETYASNNRLHFAIDLLSLWSIVNGAIFNYSAHVKNVDNINDQTEDSTDAQWE